MQLSNAESILNQSIDEVYREVTIDISRTVKNGACEIPLDDDGDPFVKQTVDLTEESYSGQGFAGLNKALVLIEKKLTAILTNTCAAIEPNYEIDLSEFAKNCNIVNIFHTNFFTTTILDEP